MDYSGATNKAKTFVNQMKESWIIVMVIAAMIIIVIVVVYIFSLIKSNKMKNVVLQDNMFMLDDKNTVPFNVASSKLTLVASGQEYTYSFWMFISANYDSTTDYKLVMQRGNTSGTPGSFSASTSHIVAMDPTINRMYVAVATSAVNIEMNTGEVFAQDQNTGFFTSGYLVTYIDYVPLQRWVNVTFVVKDSNLILYVDADIYSTVNVSDAANNNRGMIKGNSGNLVIGEKRNTIHGYISLTSFWNYALSQKDIQSVYKNGPVQNSWLAYLGLAHYGVRTPIYEIA
jgi:hypothetical protein